MDPLFPNLSNEDSVFSSINFQTSFLDFTLDIQNPINLFSDCTTMPRESYEIDVEVESKPERTLVLLGKTGNGKSATGNTILGENKFSSKGRAKFITKQCEMHGVKLPNGQQINVIDTPGLFSASSTLKFTTREIIRCLLLAKNGIDAVLLVFSAGGRLTQEEQSTLGTLKILFGPQIVDYMIVVFTHEDQLIEDGETLDEYLSDCSELQEILQECNDRKVAFDNRRSTSKSKKDKQVQELLNLVEEIAKKNNGKPYMNEIALELRENAAKHKEKLKEVKEMKGWYSKKDVSEIEKMYNKKNEEISEKFSNLLKESVNDLKDQLAKSEAEKKETLKKLTETQKLSADEIRRLREQLIKAENENASLKRQICGDCIHL